MLWTIISLIMIVTSLFTSSIDVKSVLFISSGLFAIAAAIGYVGSKIVKLTDTLTQDKK